MNIAIVDYGVGNLRSVQKSLERVAHQSKVNIVNDKESILNADKLVLPGVGAIQAAKQKLEELDLINPLKDFASSGKSFLGICVGFQLLFDKSFEGGEIEGLGLIEGEVRKFSKGKVPHMGWNQINIKNECPLFDGIKSLANLYFCHSYYAIPKDENVIATSTNYNIDFTSSVWQNNIFGTQFHPEKSQLVGLKILENFIK